MLYEKLSDHGAEFAAGLRSQASSWLNSPGKRAFDIGFAVLLLPFLVPVIAVLWATIRLGASPGIFGHTRIGRDGAPFRCWKLRTMVPDAQERLSAYLSENPEAAAEWSQKHKLSNDPRITRLGAFLRKTSLDELPQIWNVLKGEMSFVGSRPIVRDELKKYADAQAAYLAQRPGVTGLWQVSGRNDISYDERVRMDLAYIRSASLLTDLKIVCQTVLVILMPTGR